LHPQFAKDPEFVTMFLDEARLAARIHHPSVVQTLDVVATRGEVFIVMEYVQGTSLARLWRYGQERKELAPLSVISRIVADVLQGLHAAHEARDQRGRSLNLVHRDVSPQNILVGTDGLARLLDFGIAKAAGQAHTTAEGQVKGKLAYMPPEQLIGARLTRIADLYAVAVVLWECVTGRRLFLAESEADLVAKVVRHEIERPSYVRELPPALEELILKGLDQEPKRRFSTAREMFLALESCGPLASAVAVGEWVGRCASETLADLAVKLAAVETESHALPPRPSAPPPAPESKPPRGASPTAPSSTVVTQLAGVTVPDVRSVRTVSRRSRASTLAAASALVAAVTVAIAFLRLRAPPVAAAPSLPPSASMAAATPPLPGPPSALALSAPSASATPSSPPSVSAPVARNAEPGRAQRAWRKPAAAPSSTAAHPVQATSDGLFDRN
jgi:serine/threonine-protein kinase